MCWAGATDGDAGHAEGEEMRQLTTHSERRQVNACITGICAAVRYAALAEKYMCVIVIR